MIKGINSSSQYITIQGGNPMQNYFSPGAQGAGQMRYNTNSNNVEVWDGVTWKEMLTSYASVDLSHEAQSLLQWARQTRDKELARDARIRDNPSLQKAYEAIQRAEENFDILDKIIGDTVVKNAVN
jgi:organic radical activating enzyme